MSYDDEPVLGETGAKNKLNGVESEKEREKIGLCVTPPLGIPLLDWYLCCLRFLSDELKKYEDVELYDTYNLMDLQKSHTDDIRKRGTDLSKEFISDSILEKINDQLFKEYAIIRQYCPEITYEKFIQDNKWLGESNIQKYLEFWRKNNDK